MAECPEGFVKNPITGECVEQVKVTVDTGTMLGGIDPNYKMPTSYGTADKPYGFETKDLNIIYKI